MPTLPSSSPGSSDWMGDFDYDAWLEKEFGSKEIQGGAEEEKLWEFMMNNLPFQGASMLFCMAFWTLVLVGLGHVAHGCYDRFAETQQLTKEQRQHIQKVLEKD